MGTKVMAVFMFEMISRRQHSWESYSPSLLCLMLAFSFSDYFFRVDKRRYISVGYARHATQLMICHISQYIDSNQMLLGS